MPLHGSLDSGLFDPGGFIPGYSYNPAPVTSAPISSTQESAPWWSGFITDAMRLTPNIISATQGHPYASTPYGQSSYGGAAYGGGGVYAGGSVLGASGFGQISTTTLLLIGLAAFLLLRRR